MLLEMRALSLVVKPPHSTSDFLGPGSCLLLPAIADPENGSSDYVPAIDVRDWY